MSKNFSKHVNFLYHQQDGMCFYCGTPDMFLREDVTREFAKANHRLRATFDHIVPVTQGGKNSRENGVCACGYCNSTKGDTPYEDFIANYDHALTRSIVLVQHPEQHKVATPKQMKRILANQRTGAMIKFCLVLLATNTNQSIGDILEFFKVPVQIA